MLNVINRKKHVRPTGHELATSRSLRPDVIQCAIRSDFMRKPLSASSLRLLRSADQLVLFVPRTRTALAQRRSFAVVGPSAWNDLLPPLRAKLLSGLSSSSARSLKTFLLPRGFYTESASE